MRARTWQVGALLFGSGCCALVYQIGWLREFRLIFGASTAASAAVLAIFIGGLGLGGLLLGPRADRHPRPILFYAQLETIKQSGRIEGSESQKEQIAADPPSRLFRLITALVLEEVPFVQLIDKGP